MAEAVEQALNDHRILLCEAGTGTGKTLAYLLPALLSGRKVIVSTATRALQEQIFFKDIPVVAQAFGIEPRVALMKGVSNYLCRRRFEEFRASPESLRPLHARSLGAVDAWVRETETGDLAELGALDEEDPVRLHVASSSETRIGAACEHYESCFVTAMKREAEAAQLVVVNHHLFFADLALRGPHPARVLPDYDAVIFDEAHQIEDVATEFFSVRVSSLRVTRLLSDMERALKVGGLADPLFGGGGLAVIESTRLAANHFFHELARRGSPDTRVALERDVWVGELQRAFHTLDSALESVAATLSSTAGQLANSSRGAARGAGEALFVAERRTDQVREQLSTIVDAGRGRVVWLEAKKTGTTLSSTPVDLSVLLRERVFEVVPAVVLTSATLATESGSPKPGSESAPASVFSYLRKRFGLEDDGGRVSELLVSSPFDFAEQALLYTPSDLPAPGTPAFWDAASLRIRELVAVTGGGCFVLTTSLRAMREIHGRLVGELGGLPLFMQGQAPKAALVSRFRAAENAVLCATSSFWEGVDVPGRALRLVVLEKIPFPVPSDPIVSARSRVLEEAGDNPFLKLHVPMAALALKQGFGRLVRTQRDVGIVALLDERVHRRGYGAKLLRALPPARRTPHLSEVKEFWAARHPDERRPEIGEG
jgi:ATP-dependent DNA helicase DinG